MLRHHVQKSSADAKRYYQTADYYAEDMEQRAALGGKAAELLEVEGSSDKTHFERLCDNLHPKTGEKLTARMKDERIVGVDLTFDGPKGFGVLAALTGDPRLREALRMSAEETMAELEQAAATRVRKKGRVENRTTGNLVWYHATHETTRPVDGVPDMQPHDHFFVLNATFDPVEKQWKAANLYDILRDMPYYQAAFHQRLARRLENLGYGVNRKGNYFEVSSIPPSVITKFSRRKNQIEAVAAKEGITDPKLKSMLGAKTRAHKIDHFTAEQLHRIWVSRLTKSEMDRLSETVELAQARARTAWLEPCVTAEQALEHAAAHVFERKSSAPARELLAEALTYGVGAFSVEDAWKYLEKRGDRFTCEVDGRLFAASHKVLSEEKFMIDAALYGHATEAPVHPGWEIEDHRLNIAQRAAVHHLLSSQDFVTMVIGDAGVGKTTLLKDAVRGAEKGAQEVGYKVFAFAPSADASRGTLRSEGFEGADTVAALLVNKEIQEQVRGQIILIDEAALLGTKDTAAVLRLAKELHARVWLVGDDKQHRAVQRGTPFHLLQTRAGIKPARVAKIQRQKGDYKKAVELARDKPAEAIARLKEMGWLKEVPEDERYKLLADDYLNAVKWEKANGQWREPTALVVAPTHAEGAKVTAAIRAARRAEGKLGEDHQVSQLTNMHMTEAQRADAFNYEAGLVLQFEQNAKGRRRGERVEITEEVDPPTHLAGRFNVYRTGTLAVARGDRLRITHNGCLKDGHRLNNGEIITVADVTRHGIVDQRGWLIPTDFGHVAHGYAVTSVASQSRTVDRLLAAMGPESLGAINREQLYVTLSRGKEWARIYSHSAAELARAVKKDEIQISATELAERRRHQKAWRKRLQGHVMFLQRRARQEERYAQRCIDRPHPPMAQERKEQVHER